MVRAERRHERADAKLKSKTQRKIESEPTVNRGVGGFCDIQQYLGLMMKGEKTERGS